MLPFVERLTREEYERKARHKNVHRIFNKRGDVWGYVRVRARWSQIPESKRLRNRWNFCMSGGGQGSNNVGISFDIHEGEPVVIKRAFVSNTPDVTLGEVYYPKGGRYLRQDSIELEIINVKLLNMLRANLGSNLGMLEFHRVDVDQKNKYKVDFLNARKRRLTVEQKIANVMYSNVGKSMEIHQTLPVEALREFIDEYSHFSVMTHWDLHLSNIMFSNDKFHLIDFGRMYIQLLDKPQYESKVKQVIQQTLAEIHTAEKASLIPKSRYESLFYTLRKKRPAWIPNRYCNVYDRITLCLGIYHAIYHTLSSKEQAECRLQFEERSLIYVYRNIQNYLPPNLAKMESVLRPLLELWEQYAMFLTPGADALDEIYVDLDEINMSSAGFQFRNGPEVVLFVRYQLAKEIPKSNIALFPGAEIVIAEMINEFYDDNSDLKELMIRFAREITAFLLKQPNSSISGGAFSSMSSLDLNASPPQNKKRESRPPSGMKEQSMSSLDLNAAASFPPNKKEQSAKSRVPSGKKEQSMSSLDLNAAASSPPNKKKQNKTETNVNSTHEERTAFLSCLFAFEVTGISYSMWDVHDFSQQKGWWEIDDFEASVELQGKFFRERLYPMIDKIPLSSEKVNGGALGVFRRSIDKRRIKRTRMPGMKDVIGQVKQMSAVKNIGEQVKEMSIVKGDISDKVFAKIYNEAWKDKMSE